MAAVKVLCFTLSAILFLSASSVSGKVLKNATPTTASGGVQKGVNGTRAAPISASTECSNLHVNSTQLELAKKADIVVTGVAVAAGPGVGVCLKDGSLVPVFDNSTKPSTNFVVLGIQCVNKGLIHCRENAEDTQDCLIVVELPVQPLAAPCGLSEGGRYMFMLKAKPDSCGGVYQAFYSVVSETIRQPMGGTGCTYYPEFAPVGDMVQRLKSQCQKPIGCPVNKCLPTVTQSPCANDTMVDCNLKSCQGKYMYHNAVLPNETCYEMYTWGTSGLPVNCYGRNYITNRISAIQASNPNTTASSTHPSVALPNTKATPAKATPNVTASSMSG